MISRTTSLSTGLQWPRSLVTKTLLFSRGGWVWPERAVAWKKEASLETPLADAAPCIKLFSEKAIEADTPERLIASCDVQATPAEINFVTSFCQEYGREKARRERQVLSIEFSKREGIVTPISISI